MHEACRAPLPNFSNSRTKGDVINIDKNVFKKSFIFQKIFFYHICEKKTNTQFFFLDISLQNSIYRVEDN